MRIIYMFHNDEPGHGSVLPGALPNPTQAYRGYVPLMLTQRITAKDDPAPTTNDRNVAAHQTVYTGNPATYSMLELRNQDVELPQADETRFWCKMFELQDFRQKHHLIKVCVFIACVSKKKFLLFAFLNGETGK